MRELFRKNKGGVMWVSERVVKSLYGYKVHSEGPARHVQGDLNTAPAGVTSTMI